MKKLLLALSILIGSILLICIFVPLAMQTDSTFIIVLTFAGILTGGTMIVLKYLK